MAKEQNQKPPDEAEKPQAPPGPTKKLTRSEIMKDYHKQRIVGKPYKKKKKKRVFIPGQTRNKHEGQRHIDAFEFYYKLGDDRSLAKVAAEFQVSEQSAREWSRSFNWLLRVEQRDIEINRQLQKKLINSIVKAKADYRKDIQLAFMTVKHTIAGVAKRMQVGETLPINDAADLNTAVNAMEKLVRLDLTLLGEDKGDLGTLPQTIAEFSQALMEKWKLDGGLPEVKNGKKNGGN